MNPTRTSLSVNLNKIALLRNSREGNYPSVTAHAEICLAAGADGITVHPRPDQRHIRPGDVYDLAALTASMPVIEFNIEGNPFAPAQGSYPGFMELVRQTRPDQCTLVPDSDDQLTSDHGFDLTQSGDKLRPIIDELHELGCRVSLFMDPDPAQIRLAKGVGADRVELYTGPYALAHKEQSDNLDTLFRSYHEATLAAAEVGLGVNAGHDLNLDNLARFLEIPGILEVSIGHALTVDAIAMGMGEAVNRYRRICHHENR
ncbi:pyridoxine 5'-phosphate synthase [Pseudomaricurvus sp. HS19]|uniref:pyridoxine 5'-phosphate synthase n=1 Tax=Pseudomaricurvus sp. HS19 TaxID=2692626 RepID=UPI00136C4FF8|nr:pyridoxine 5'-phosphate synthase [Pseudomaricurvus sp. HS19]MYM62662.1 pyridoxine 5'-phosphate synthase [Pseudomaricurvus sp. HS19]